MPNTIAYAEVFQRNLDTLAVQDAVTGWMDQNAGQVIYSGGKSIKIPKIDMDGLGDYSRANGYDRGAVTLEYETKEMTQDRGKQFLLDSQDIDESNFVVNAGMVMGEFQRTKVIPEIDAYRLSKIASAAITLDKSVVYGYTPEKATILDAMKDAIASVRKAGFRNVPLVIHATTDACNALEKARAEKGGDMTFTVAGVSTQVPAIDNVPIIETDDNRMYTSITIKSTTSGGGYEKGSTAKDINFMVMAMQAPIAVNKQDNLKIFDPAVVQDADAWKIDYRRYHDLWMAERKVAGVALSIKEAKA